MVICALNPSNEEVKKVPLDPIWKIKQKKKNKIKGWESGSSGRPLF
jgi:hypothetical protein